VVHMASSRRSRGCEGKDERFYDIGCDVAEVSPNYHSLVAICLLAHRGILVLLAHRGILVFRTIGPLWEASLSHPLGFSSLFC
jgi:hypothetical protein